jgi:two-component system chemotaxis response regulator CheY
VDDEASILKLVKAILTKAGYDVATCGSATDALRLLAASDFDGVITDAVMPVMSGYDLVKTLRGNARFRDVPILMLTRKRQPEDVKKALNAGVNDYVLKPIDPTLLVDKVNLCVSQGKGARQVFEAPVDESQARAEVVFGARIMTVSEAGLVARLPVPLQDGLAFHLSAPVFNEIGIAPPLLKLQDCQEDRHDGVPGFKTLPYIVRLAFVGLAESELMKIRTWAQRQDIRRRK